MERSSYDLDYYRRSRSHTRSSSSSTNRPAPLARGDSSDVWTNNSIEADIGIALATIGILVTGGSAWTAIALAAATARLAAMGALYGVAATATVVIGAATIDAAKYTVRGVRPGVFAIIKEVHRVADEIEARGGRAIAATSRTGESAMNLAQDSLTTGANALESVQHRVSKVSQPARSMISSAFSLDTLNPFRRFSGNFTRDASLEEDLDGIVEVSTCPSNSDINRPDHDTREVSSAETEYYDVRNMTEEEILASLDGATNERVIFVSESQLLKLCANSRADRNIHDERAIQGLSQHAAEAVQDDADDTNDDDWETIDSTEHSSVNSDTFPSAARSPILSWMKNRSI